MNWKRCGSRWRHYLCVYQWLPVCTLPDRYTDGLVRAVLASGPGEPEAWSRRQRSGRHDGSKASCVLHSHWFHLWFLPVTQTWVVLLGTSRRHAINFSRCLQRARYISAVLFISSCFFSFFAYLIDAIFDSLAVLCHCQIMRPAHLKKRTNVTTTHSWSEHVW